MSKWAGNFTQPAANASAFVYFDRARIGISYQRARSTHFHTGRFNTLQTGNLHMGIRRRRINMNSGSGNPLPFSLYHGTGQFTGAATNTSGRDDNQRPIHGAPSTEVPKISGRFHFACIQGIANNNHRAIRGWQWHIRDTLLKSGGRRRRHTELSQILFPRW
jgi:hypothetical protein